MPLFKSKPKLSIEDCCREFYTLIFHPHDSNLIRSELVKGTDVWSGLLDTYFESIAEIDQSFLSVDPVLFRNEMTALRMELFAFALGCSKKFGKEKYTIPASFFTRSYLEENGRLDIWSIMGEYNQAIAMSATMSANGKPTPGRIGRSQMTFINSMRANVASKWLKTNFPGITNEAIDKDEKVNTKISCANLVFNRLGADIKHADGVVVKLLASRLANRLGCDVNLKSEALSRLASIIFGFYNGAEEYLKSVDLRG